MGNPFEKQTRKADVDYDEIDAKIDARFGSTKSYSKPSSSVQVKPSVLEKPTPPSDIGSEQNKTIEEAKKKIVELETDGKLKKPVYGKKKEYKKINIFHRRKAVEERKIGEGFIPPNVVEIKPRIDIAKISMYLSILGIISVVMIAQSSFIQAPVVMILMLFFGMSCFLPMGLILGWLFLNIDMRCKILRRMRGKNYGIIHFVLRGSQHLITRIMDFDGDVIVSDMRMWVIDDKGVHYIDRDGKKQHWADITSDHIKTLPANIPCLYLDYETMVPLKFYKEQSKSDPLQVGSTHLGYIANQIAKNMLFKKAMTLFYIIVIVLCAISVVIAVQEAMWLDELRKQVPDIQNKVNTLVWVLTNQSGVNGSGGVPDFVPPPGVGP